MYCLNCGSHLNEAQNHCSCCNIRISAHGIMRKNEIPIGGGFSNQSSIEEKSKCPNCLEPLISENANKCNCCNYNLKQGRKGNRAKPKSDNGHFKFTRGDIQFTRNIEFN